MVHRLLANPTVTFDGHSGLLPFVFNLLIFSKMNFKQVTFVHPTAYLRAY